MLNQELTDLLNNQVTMELKNHVQYKIIARVLNNLHLMNLSKFFEEQADGEHDHFEKFFGYLSDNHETPAPVMTPAQEIVPTSLDGLCELYLRAEQNTTILIVNMMVLAKRVGDEKTQAWLQWALEEQIEEEDQARMLTSAYEMCNRNWPMVDLLYAKQ
jgi:ferritin